MKRLIVLFLLFISFSSCYTVVRVGNCKYYYKKYPISSKGRAHAPIGF